MNSQTLHLKYDGRCAMITSTTLRGKIPWAKKSTSIMGQTRVRFPYVCVYPHGWERAESKVPGRRGKITTQPLFKIHYRDIEKVEFLKLVD